MARPPAGIETYKDERLLWQAATQKNYLELQCKTRAATVQLIQRLHTYRALHRRESFEGTYSRYDDFIIKNPGKTTTVIIEPRNTLDNIVIVTEGVDLQRAQRELESFDYGKSSPINDEIQQLERKYEQTRKLKIDPDKPLDLE